MLIYDFNDVCKAGCIHTWAGRGKAAEASALLLSSWFWYFLGKSYTILADKVSGDIG